MRSEKRKRFEFISWVSLFVGVCIFQASQNSAITILIVALAFFQPKAACPHFTGSNVCKEKLLGPDFPKDILGRCGTPQLLSSHERSEPGQECGPLAHPGGLGRRVLRTGRNPG